MTNTLVTEWDGDAAQLISDVVFVQRSNSGWAVATVARYRGTFRNSDGTWRWPGGRWSLPLRG